MPFSIIRLTCIEEILFLNLGSVLGRVCKPHANQIIEEASFKNATNVQANLS